jgi:hypothetical protein
MSRLSTVLGAALSAALLAGCVKAPEVVQGTVVSFDQAPAPSVVVRDERAPNAELRFALEGCEIGADPVPGDEVRVAYLEENGALRALRVMNLTRQAEVGKKGQASSASH